MKPVAARPFWLVPESGIDIVEGRTVAVAAEAWLRVEPVAAFARRKWIRLRYSAGFFDEPVRPLIRFRTRAGPPITLPMNGPVLGSAEWIGRVPDDTIAVSISPVRRPGPFAFRIDEISSVSRAALVRRGLRRPDWLYWAVRSRLLNSRREAWQSLCFAACGTPMEAYGAWRARHARPLELETLDRPRAAWRDGPIFHLILDLAGGGDPADVDGTIHSLRDQAYTRWRLHAANTETAWSAAVAAFRRHAAGDPRLVELAADFPGERPQAAAAAADDFVAVLQPGDLLASHALAVVAERLSENPKLELISCDEDRVTADGRFSCPALEPRNPMLRDVRLSPYRAVWLRARSVEGDRARKLLSDFDDVVEGCLGATPDDRICHIRRPLYSRRDGGGEACLPPRLRNQDAIAPQQWPSVAVVIPTRDQAKLLSRCIAGLRQRTDYPEFDIVLVDNGSTEADALRLLGALADAPRTTVLRRPGAFNFSALCNAGARATQASVFLFLNNDIAVLAPSWLKAMVRFAVKPEVGAVGAKLLFPNGLIQHAGVVLGFGGIAGHVYRRLRKDCRGYLGQLAAPRQVAAVTAACVAVERAKFDAVGGFDAENLPVDLNDIDFCLRLHERGWANVWTPEATLIHVQSATRGIDSDPYALYGKERDYFVRRWAHVIRDDPCFHPALSLYAHEVMLA